MDLKQAIDMLEESDEFSEWKKENAHCYLAHAFTVFESENVQDDWQIGFYNKDTDKIIVFVLGDEGQNITKNPETDALKEEGKIIEQIDISKVKTDITDMLHKAKDIQKKKYPSDLIFKTIVILQNLKDYGIIWNITFVTHTFKTLNIKIDAKTGDVKEDRIVSIVERVSGERKD